MAGAYNEITVCAQLAGRPDGVLVSRSVPGALGKHWEVDQTLVKGKEGSRRNVWVERSHGAAAHANAAAPSGRMVEGMWPNHGPLSLSNAARALAAGSGPRMPAPSFIDRSTSLTGFIHVVTHEDTGAKLLATFNTDASDVNLYQVGAYGSVSPVDLSTCPSLSKLYLEHLTFNFYNPTSETDTNECFSVAEFQWLMAARHDMV